MGVTESWSELESQRDRLAASTTADLFARDPDRVAHCTLEAAGVLLDHSRQLVDDDVLQSLHGLGQSVGVPVSIQKLFEGEPVNVTENRAALHAALRQPAGAGIGGAVIERQVLAERARMLHLAEQVRSGRLKSASGLTFKDVVNIGIGGSDLGPLMAVRALKPWGVGAPRIHGVGNIDGAALGDLLTELDPRTTLFVVVSKTFTTEETLSNAEQARQWLHERAGAEAVARQIVGVSANAQAMNEFGISPALRLEFWEWVGGRYSLWSSVGFVLAVAIGAEHFEALLAGAHRMDLHFRDTPLEANLPVRLALLGVWNVNLQKLPALAVLPYDSRLARWPAFLQQLEMESNGKGVTRSGEPVAHETAPVVFGEPGNEAQHSFYQLLHQGTARAALDILVNAAASEATLSHAIAQAEAFLYGLRGADIDPARRQPGDRPVNLVMFRTLDPATLGALIAAYEHKVFVQSVLWDVNAFDQFGVELGKRMAREVKTALRNPQGASETTPSLRGTLANLARLRSKVWAAWWIGAALSALSLAPNSLRADPWLAPGNLALRQDVQLLADHGVIRSPAMTWPMSWPDIARDVLAAPVSVANDPLLEHALERVRRAARDASVTGPGGLEWRAAASADPTPLRTFADVPREEGEVAVAMSVMSERIAGRIEVTAVANPQDGRAIRFDGSYLGFNVGNFMVSAGYMQRWWGPGFEGSLILGTNARPIPSVTIERNYTDPFETRWLKWLGPWRASIA
ncbi:MAG: Glucose-6-phosphate isomerase, partial [Pseudomonadota bacterium]